MLNWQGTMRALGRLKLGVLRIETAHLQLPCPLPDGRRLRRRPLFGPIAARGRGPLPRRRSSITPSAFHDPVSSPACWRTLLRPGTSGRAAHRAGRHAPRERRMRHARLGGRRACIGLGNCLFHVAARHGHAQGQPRTPGLWACSSRPELSDWRSARSGRSSGPGSAPRRCWPPPQCGSRPGTSRSSSGVRQAACPGAPSPRSPSPSPSVR